MGTLKRLFAAWYKLRMRVRWTPNVGLAYARSLGVEVGEGSRIYDVGFGSEPWLVKVGRNTWLTAGTQLVTHDGSIRVIKNGPYAVANPASLNRYGKIVIGDNCFVGIRSIILPNVTVGNNCIVAAGSVVTKDVPDGTIVGGNPARVIGTTADFALKVVAESLPIPNTWPDPEAKKKGIRPFFLADELGS